MSIERRYQAVLERITAAAQRSGRQAEDITLVTVTKTWPAETVVAAHRAGMRHFGENRAEELSRKLPAVEAALGPDSGISWHAIGALQSRKTNLVADTADVFHALDRAKIANRLSRRLVENGRGDVNPLLVFVEVNLSGEATKSGLDCRDWEASAEQKLTLQQMARLVVELPGLVPLGLMTMAPWQVEEDVIRSVFRRLRELSQWLQNAEPEGQWSKLSMGMTDDFEIAIEEGATHIRVGRAIFGPRL
ncbi:MAG TPA: YggS family pyridoxal phosphate-dependent enzyme [Anaerolineae bacterium]|jgi:pyridoxal phosphate enzyme (YggS family)|nr:YggS family pyridoxal phosphate-dependent enzyme [Anaerolineae bacterium]